MQSVQHGDQLQAEAVQAGEPVPSLQLRAARLLARQGHVQEHRPAAGTGSLSILGSRYIQGHPCRPLPDVLHAGVLGEVQPAGVGAAQGVDGEEHHPVTVLLQITLVNSTGLSVVDPISHLFTVG